ncbi:hypothetical protein [Pseudomonas sp. QTF5]|uniref:hypothetical protein n=1 Tax=Pseudomonas sp. QTF5 TaxID=1435425 RepID=UPI0004B7A43D|nr:hypothetical protein [Pseudomonas sp. QTF5]
MFELEKTSIFFEHLALKEPLLVQNMEIMFENQTQLNTSYHNPKQFILNLNNLLRSTLFFVETSIKNTSSPLKTTVNEFRKNHSKEYEILKHLRNVSVHQTLIFPEESLVSGLYRVKSDTEYLLKLGFGDHSKPGKYSWDLALKNTQDIFHDLLTFHSITFMDLEHSALWECLGVTRKWFFKVKFNNQTTKFDEVIDIYELACNFTAKLLDSVCIAYAQEMKIQCTHKFHQPLKEHNFVNTILEIDLYPSLFTEWWEEDTPPLNFGTLVERNEGDKHLYLDNWHKQAYENLCNTPMAYKTLLIKYSNASPDACFNKENRKEFTSFIILNHWHFKNSFNASLMDSPLDATEIMAIQRLGKIFINENSKGKLCTINSSFNTLKKHLLEVSEKIK